MQTHHHQEVISMITATGTGRLTRDPDCHTTKGGKTVTTLRIASNGPSRDAGADYVDVECWERLAQACAEHLGKGRQIAFSGALRYEEWKTADGSVRSRHKIVAHQVEFLGAPRANDNTDSDEPADGEPSS
jgi:single-strand DNA-binding protein